MPTLRIVCLTILAMVGYGIAQDQVTARLCPEYFTIGHPPIPGLTDPTLLGIAWGFLGAWWGGLMLGIGLAISSQVGSAPPLAVRQLIRPLATLFLIVTCVATLAGLGTAYNARLLGITLGEPWASQIPAERHQAMLIVANTHFAAYGSAILGGIMLCIHIACHRHQASDQ